MRAFEIGARDHQAIDALLAEVAGSFSSLESPEFLAEATVLAHELPRGLRAFLNEFRLGGMARGACKISGYRVDDRRIGPTPRHWNARSMRSAALNEEAFVFLVSSLLGDVFGWATQQAGYLVHDVLPIQEHEHEQIGTGSKEFLTWHTEDAFHPFRGDHVALMCLRNPCGVGTLLASTDLLALEERHARVLFERRFVIRPDHSHQRAADSTLEASAPALPARRARAYDQIEKMQRDPEPVAVLWGDPSSPYLCADPYFMELPEGDAEAGAALAALVRQVDEKLWEAHLRPGDILLVDNRRAVHARRPFGARYDGRDRWLKRVLTTQDLAKSACLRSTPTSRVLY